MVQQACLLYFQRANIDEEILFKVDEYGKLSSLCSPLLYLFPLSPSFFLIFIVVVFM